MGDTLPGSLGWQVRQPVGFGGSPEGDREIVVEWLERHAAMTDNLTALRDDKDRESLVVDGRLRLEHVLGRSLAESMVRDTAWETAKTTGLVRHFDLRCANSLTDIYGLQQVVERQIWKTAGILGERETHQEEQILHTLALLELHLQELQGQGRLFATAYDEALATLDGDGFRR